MYIPVNHSFKWVLRGYLFYGHVFLMVSNSAMDTSLLERKSGAGYQTE